MFKFKKNINSFPTHHHIVKSSSLISPWKCDFCHTIGNKYDRFRCCDGCDFDLCKKCFLNILLIIPGDIIDPKHHHPLHVVTFAQAWLCDGCGRSGNNNTRYRCKSNCDFDLCSSCITGFSLENEINTSKHIHAIKLSHNTQMWQCDLCSTINPKERYSCNRGCDFDICGNCFANNDIHKEENTEHGVYIDNHEHMLLPSDRNTMWYCNICTSNKNLSRYRCSSSCDYDVCTNCIRKIKQDTLFENLHNHSLQLTKRSKNWMCDICKQLNSKDTPRYRCPKSCDFDVCVDCISNHQEFYDKNHNHPLSKSLLTSGWICDACRLCRTTERYRCTRGCDFDLCGMCCKGPQEDYIIETKNNKPIEKPIEIPKEETPDDNPPNDITSQSECIICFDELKNRFVFIPCGHANCCEECCKLQKDCPICRKPIQLYTRVYL